MGINIGGPSGRRSSPIQIGSKIGWNLENSHNTDNQFVMVRIIT